jgi:hypothetical protein
VRHLATVPRSAFEACATWRWSRGYEFECARHVAMVRRCEFECVRHVAMVRRYEFVDSSCKIGL